MSKYQITHSCGCTVTHNIVGTNVNGERERKAAWLADRACTECYRKEQQTKAAESNKDLPTLTGSDKQIAWAEQIRAQAAKSLCAVKEHVAANHDKDPANADKLLATIDSTLAQTESRYWIDNRANAFDARWVISQIK